MRGPRALALCLPVLAALSAAACAPMPGARVEANVKTVRAEQTPDKLLERGRAFAAVGDYTRAEQYLAAALEQGAEPRVALPSLLKVCVAEKRYRVAIDYAEPVLQKHPGDHHLRFVVGSLYATIGQSRIAREHLEIIAREEPDYADVHYALALILRNDEADLQGADHHFREYLRLKPAGPHAEEARNSLLKTIP